MLILAQDRLRKLRSELDQTESEMQRAAAELERLAKESPNKMSNNDKQYIRAKLAKKINTVSYIKIKYQLVPC